jgi:hypothetical protein
MERPWRTLARLTGLSRFARFEQALAAVLIPTPFLLWWVDDVSELPRSSISAYHDMSPPQVFYVPLTVLATLLLVNGVLKKEHWYNLGLGVLLFGVILVDHNGAKAWVHEASAVGFFVGNTLVVFLGSKEISWRLRLVFGLAIVAAVLAWRPLELITTYWVEVLSMLVIAAHYILDSISDARLKYRALRRGEPSDLRLWWRARRRARAG